MSNRELWGKVMGQRQAKYPREDIVRFVARNYYGVPDRSEVRFLDLGCGAGAISQYLCGEGFTVDAVDQIRPATEPNYATFTFYESDLTEWDYPENKYDCVIDNTTLCHVREYEAVLESVHESLKEGGKLFSIFPTVFNHTSLFIDKGYTKKFMHGEAQDVFKMFSNVKVGRLSYTDMSVMKSLTYWLIEGTK